MTPETVKRLADEAIEAKASALVDVFNASPGKAYSAQDAKEKTPAEPVAPKDKHLTLLGAPWHLNLLTGQDRQDMLSFGRAVWAAAIAAPSPDVAVPSGDCSANGEPLYHPPAQPEAELPPSEPAAQELLRTLNLAANPREDIDLDLVRIVCLAALTANRGA